MSAAMELDPRVAYIQSHVTEDLEFRPEYQRALARTLIALLDLSVGQEYDYFLSPVTNLIIQLEKQLASLYRKEHMPLLQSIKAASILVELDEETREQVREYLDRLVAEGQEEISLERFMCEKFEATSRSLYSSVGMFSNPLFAAMKMISSSNVEDFELYLNQPLSNNEINATIVDYYIALGYEIESSHFGLWMKKGQTRLFSNVSNHGHRILVSIIPVRV